MLTTLHDLRAFRAREGFAEFEGRNGRLALGTPAPGIVSVAYEFNEGLVPPEESTPDPDLASPAASLERGRAWESIGELSEAFELCCGPLRVLVDKATARVDVFEDGILVHGGKIGDKDTVIPQEPLRVQQTAPGYGTRGKFNFRLDPSDAFFGLGEKTGSLNKRGRAFKLFNRDALGYDAARSDPLYISVPFFIKANRGDGSMCGIYFPNLRVEEVDFGVESLFYYHVKLQGGPFSYYVLTGKDYKGILASYCSLTGFPALPPLFSFGYIASSMAYTDPDDAERRVLGFFDRVEAEGLPCEGMFFSSGYARTERGERHTFVWNRRKFPQPKAFLEGLRARGYRVSCNVKPGILSSHPWYRELAEKRVFIPGHEGAPLLSYYWGNNASLVDFSRNEGFNWWKRSIVEHILGQGVSGIWNDNNEFEIEDDSLPIQKVKNHLPVLMARSSYEAMREVSPGKRPWLVSRAGYAGLQRYARTWTGDNVSTYDSMLGNLAMGLNLGLSGLPFFGHDIGGFYGPNPDEELLLRWCQSAVFQPRFVMHSWKADGSITEPWTFPDKFAAIKTFILQRYRFLPYLYDLAVRAHQTGAPMESHPALDFSSDPALDPDDLSRMVGDAILVPAPPPRGSNGGRIRLPDGANWYDMERRILLRGGRDLDFDYPPDSLRYFFRAGSIVPTAEGLQSVGKGRRIEPLFLLFPPVDRAELVHFHYEDDGESDFVEGSHWRHRMEFSARGTGAWSFVSRTEARGREENRAPVWKFRLPEGFSFFEGERGIGSTIEVPTSREAESVELVIRGEYGREAN